MTSLEEVDSWASITFGKARLGDRRRVARLVAMATRAAADPSGKISEVFTNDAERQGAYDFLESGHIGVACILSAMTGQAATECASEPRVVVPVDGSSLTLVDRADTKDFGAVGAYTYGARGIKVISALAVTESGGVPLGLLAQVFWNRPTTKPKKTKKRRGRKVKDKETQRWIEALQAAAEELDLNAPKTRAWFQLDREGDSSSLLLALAALAESGHDFTVRGRWDRPIDDRLGGLRRKLAYSPTKGSYTLDVPGGPNRTARTADMVVATAKLTVRLKDPTTGKLKSLELTAILAREIGTVPKGEQRIEWLLLTSVAVNSLDDAMHVIRTYASRWRIEEFHKTWKSGACRVEETQLRSTEAVLRWATILAAVAVRIERLKYLSRIEPTRPASIELTPAEIEALILHKRARRKKTKKTDPISLGVMPTIADATRWIAELGGYTGKSSGGPPGSIVLGRGLERLHYIVQGLEFAKAVDARSE
jgi:hypothetical protein